MLKRILSVITVLTMLASLLVCGSTAAFAEAATAYAEDFSNAAFVTGSRIAGVADGAFVTAPSVNNGTWKWTSTDANTTNTNNKDEFTAELDDTNPVAKYNHTTQRVSGTTETNNERYGVVFDEALEGDISISFKLKGNAKAIYMYVGDDGTTDSTNYPLTSTAGKNSTWGISLFKLIQASSNVLGAYYPNTAFRDSVPSSDKGDENGSFTHSLSETEWSAYTISINTYTGETSFTCDGTARSFDACAAGVDAKVGSFYFYIERNSAVGYFYIDDITVTNNNIDTLTFAEVTEGTEGVDGITVSGSTLPATFDGLGESWNVVWSGDDVGADGKTVYHSSSEKANASLTASFYRSGSETPVGTKTFTGITITAFDAAAALTFDTIRKDNTEQGAITSDLNLVTALENNGKSYPVSWVSSHPDVVSTSGTVVRTAFDQPVILTATINESAVKKFHLNVAAERTSLYFDEYLTNASLPASYSAWSATAENNVWTASSSSATNLEVPAIAQDPSGDTGNKVLELRKIATRSTTDSALNVQSGLYRKLDTITSDGDSVQYVSFEIYPTASTPRTEMRVFDANGSRVAAICYLASEEAPYLQAYNGSTNTDFTDMQIQNRSLTLNTWSNITIKLDYTNNIAVTYLNGNYVGYYTLYDKNADSVEECQTLGYVYLGTERNEKNPATSSAFTTENPGLVYFDNITVRTAANEADGIYEVLSYENGTLKLRKIVNTDKDSALIAASYDADKNLVQAKLAELGTGNDRPSIITIEDFGVSGNTVKIFNWEMGTLTPVCKGILYSK